MRDIIIASASLRAAEHIKQILQSGRVFVSKIFSSGSEVLAYASIRPDALVICGKLSDMPAFTLAQMLPSGYDVIHLLPSGEPQTSFVSNMVALHMPINRLELLNTIELMSATQNENFNHHKRDADQEEILDNAKRIIMSRYHVSEREAHRLLQRRSMESGLKLIDVARMIGDE